MGLRKRWLSKEGTKGAVVVVLGFFGGRLAEAVVLDGLWRQLITIASVRMMRMSFL